MRNSLIFLICCFLSLNTLSAQDRIGTPLPPFKMPALITPDFDFLEIQDLQLDKAPHFLKTPYYSLNDMPPAFNSPLVDDVLNVLSVLNRFDAASMPFFCKIEFQMERSANLPVKFRLGDVWYVDRLEQKVDWDLGN